MLSYEQVAQVIYKEAKKKGYVVEERRSESTTSRYYTLINGRYSLHFRISDHNTNKNVITLRVDKAKNINIVEKFVKNRICDLGNRVLKGVLG